MVQNVMVQGSAEAEQPPVRGRRARGSLAQRRGRGAKRRAAASEGDAVQASAGECVVECMDMSTSHPIARHFLSPEGQAPSLRMTLYQPLQVSALVTGNRVNHGSAKPGHISWFQMPCRQYVLPWSSWEVKGGAG